MADSYGRGHGFDLFRHSTFVADRMAGRWRIQCLRSLEMVTHMICFFRELKLASAEIINLHHIRRGGILWPSLKVLGYLLKHWLPQPLRTIMVQLDLCHILLTSITTCPESASRVLIVHYLGAVL